MKLVPPGGLRYEHDKRSAWKSICPLKFDMVFCALPFGLSTSGYVFSKVVRVLVQFWRASGHLVVMFLDDGIGGHKDHHKAIESSSYIRSSLINFGFLIAEGKCVWVPSLQAIWLGYFWNMLVGKIYIADERIKKLEISIDSVLSVIANSKMPLIKVRFIACIIGQIISMQTVLGKIVQLKTRELYKSIMSRASWNAPIMLAKEAVNELEYWRANVSCMNSTGQYVSPNLDSEVLIYSDASGDGYGGYASYFDTLDASVLVGSTYPSQMHAINGLNDSCDIDMELSHRQLQSGNNSCSLGESADSGASSKVNLAPGRAVTLESGKDARVLSVGSVHENVHVNKAFRANLRKMLTSHEQFNHCRWVQGSEVTGSWSRSERLKSSTWREVEALRRVMFFNAGLLEGKKVKVYSDNKNVKSILLKGSSKSDLQSVALKVNGFCDKREITLNPEWLPRNLNERADFLSKLSPVDDWGISTWVYDHLSRAWGHHDIDRFASNLNNKCHIFNSKHWVPGTCAVDAFDQCWHGVKNWMVPPPSLGCKTLKKIVKEKAEGTLILPEWKSAPFWPLLLNSNGSYKPFIAENQILSRLNIITAGRCKKGIFTKNPIIIQHDRFQNTFLNLKVGKLTVMVIIILWLIQLQIRIKVGTSVFSIFVTCKLTHLSQINRL